MNWLDEVPTKLDLCRVVAAPEPNCNLACKHCYYSHTRVEKPHIDWKEIGRGAASCGVPVAYAGRMLTQVGLDFLSGVRESKVPYGIIDHGYTMFSASEETLRSAAWLNISIDGNKKVHDRQRGKEGSWQVAWDTVMRLKQMGCDPVVACAMSPAILEGWEEFENLLAENDVPLSSALVSPTLEVAARGWQYDKDGYRKAFEMLVSGIPKIVNLYDRYMVEDLLPELLGLSWEYNKDEAALCALRGEVRLIWRPKSLQAISELVIHYDGSFGSPDVDKIERCVWLRDGNPPPEFFERVAREWQADILLAEKLVERR